LPAYGESDLLGTVGAIKPLDLVAIDIAVWPREGGVFPGVSFAGAWHSEPRHVQPRLSPYRSDQIPRLLSCLHAEIVREDAGVIAIDGKTLRRSYDRASQKSALHLVSAWAADQRLVLGQLAVHGKSNEITAVRKLLDLLSLKGAIVTVDALNCQRAIAAQIVDQGGDYALALKGDRQALYADVSLFFDDKDLNPTSVHTATDADHGRIETRVSAVSKTR
jgi:predicted transposase YbfD/YdcC